MNSLILFEDDHLLVANKPSGVNTHKPGEFAPDGLYEWLAKRRGTAATGAFSVLHRLDKDTSGVIVFGKSRPANQSLSRQFESRQVRKSYLLLTSVRPSRAKFQARSRGAETEFELVGQQNRYCVVVARPQTGKTHQIRRQAAENGFPIVGDLEYEGEPAPRLMLHAHTLGFRHPVTDQEMTFEASVPDAFEDPDPLVAACEFRQILFGSADAAEEATDCFRLVSGEADGFPGVVVDSCAGHLLVQWQSEAPAEVAAQFYDRLRARCDPVAIAAQLATRQERTTFQWIDPPRREADAPPATFEVRENGLKFRVGFGPGRSTGLFLDQRENRRRLRAGDLRGRKLLNCFAYTCAFSVAAAAAGAEVTSVDLSRSSLAWGRENFLLNHLDSERHEFVSGDAFEWMRRFAARGRQWDLVILDPPTFSTTKKGRIFRAERDYGELAALAMPLLPAGGTLFCSTNQRTLDPETFIGMLRHAADRCGRLMGSVEYETQPFDFRVPPRDRPYLKTCWVNLR